MVVLPPSPFLFPQCPELHLIHCKVWDEFCTVSDGYKAGVWRRGEWHPAAPRSKEVRAPRGLRGHAGQSPCSAGEGTCPERPRSLPTATRQPSSFSDGRSRRLLFCSRSPCGIRPRPGLLLKFQPCFPPTPSLSCTLHPPPMLLLVGSPSKIPCTQILGLKCVSWKKLT